MVDPARIILDTDLAMGRRAPRSTTGSPSRWPSRTRRSAWSW